jgi:hypothetical protein
MVCIMGCSRGGIQPALVTPFAFWLLFREASIPHFLHPNFLILTARPQSVVSAWEANIGCTMQYGFDDLVQGRTEVERAPGMQV